MAKEIIPGTGYTLPMLLEMKLESIVDNKIYNRPGMGCKITASPGQSLMEFLIDQKKATLVYAGYIVELTLTRYKRARLDRVREADFIVQFD